MFFMTPFGIMKIENNIVYQAVSERAENPGKIRTFVVL